MVEESLIKEKKEKEAKSYNENKLIKNNNLKNNSKNKAYNKLKQDFTSDPIDKVIKNTNAEEIIPRQKVFI